jgi:Cu(I)/Ag(I) efflux system membrane protein CusA/SilA
VIGVAALLAVTLDPAIRMLFTRMEPYTFRPRLLARAASALLVGTYRPEERHPVSRALFRMYEGPCRLVLRHPRKTIAAALFAVAASVPVYFALGREFMPPLNEGSILYMPTTLPGISVTEAQRLLTMQDRILKGFPEVEVVFGKAGRAETATDPAPFSMTETTVVLKPPDEWRAKPRWYSAWAPGPLKAVLRTAWPDRISWEELVDEMDHAVRIPGTANAWTMPIRGRVDMLSTGVRTPVGVKVLGADVATIERVALDVEAALGRVRGTRGAFAERAATGRFVNVAPDRDALARFGLTVEDVQAVIVAAMGGETVSTAVEGRARYTINVRYARDLRADVDQLERILVPTKSGVEVPLRDVAAVTLRTGPSMVRNENGLLAAYVFADVAGRDPGGYVDEARRAVAAAVRLPEGVRLAWSGQYENMARVRDRLLLVVPVTLILIFALLLANTRSTIRSLIVLLAVPFSLVGAVWLLWALGYNVSVATWVGMIALMGLDAETGVFMLLFLDLSFEDARRRGALKEPGGLEEAIVHGAVKRLRPKLMTVATAMLGLMPIMWSTGAGADVMKRIAAPMVGGLATSFLLELLVYPPIYLLWRRREAR